MTFALILQICSVLTHDCNAVAIPSSFSSYENCQQAMRETWKFQDKNPMNVKDFACVVSGVSPQVAAK